MLWLLLVPGSGLVMLMIPLPLAAPHISLQASVKGSLSTLHLAVVQMEPELPVGGLGKRSTWRDTQSTPDTLNQFEEAKSVVTPIL